MRPFFRRHSLVIAYCILALAIAVAIGTATIAEHVARTRLCHATQRVWNTDRQLAIDLSVPVTIPTRTALTEEQRRAVAIGIGLYNQTYSETRAASLRVLGPRPTC